MTGLLGRNHPLAQGRKVASLKGGVLALVPRKAMEGDIVVCFVGSSVPFVLSKLGRREERWAGLGEEALK